jgi:hypothetical protein
MLSVKLPSTTSHIPDTPSSHIASSDVLGTKDKGKLCSVCLEHFILQHVYLLKSSFGHLEHIASRRGCPFCDFLYSALVKQVRAPLKLTSGNVLDEKSGCWIRTYMRIPTEAAVIYDGITRFELQVLIGEPSPTFDFWKMFGSRYSIPKPPATSPRSKYRDGSVINPRWVRSFIQDCCGASAGGSHDSSAGCGSNQVRTRSIPSMKIDLIDVELHCIVRADTSYRYCGLSYVWGRANVLSTTKRTRGSFMQPGAFHLFRPAPLIEDAICFTRMIGERFLWVDSLCITQDDEQVAGLYINRMDFIYSQAIITIVAASSASALDRLPGVFPGSRAPQQTPKIADMLMLMMIKKTRGLYTSLDDTVYKSRAWSKFQPVVAMTAAYLSIAFQELLLSSRCVILTHLEAYLTCPSFVISEISGYLPETWKRFHPLRRLIPANSTYDGICDIVAYRDLVTAYSQREFTYDVDILRAFAGVSSFLSSKMLHGSMVCGLPTSDLALALGWVSQGPTNRRHTCTATDGSGTVSLPSWSWAGWTGRKDWPPPFAFREESLAGVAGQYRADIRDFKICQKACAWICECHPPALIGSIYILRFTAECLPMSKLRIVELGVKRIYGSTENTLDRPKSQYTIQCPLQGVTLPGHEPQNNDIGGGIVFGVEPKHILDAEIFLVLLGRWRNSGYGETYIVKPRGRLSHLHGRLHMCLVARWSNKERTICERVGVAHIASSLWDQLQPNILRKHICLA